MRALGEKIRAAREAREWSLRDVARRCRLSKAQVHRIETGAVTNPSIGSLAELADALGVSLNSLAYLAADDWRDATPTEQGA